MVKDSAYKYGAGTSNNGVFALVSNVKRSTKLEGRINIYVAPKSENTEVSVNTRYIFTTIVSSRVNTENSRGQIIYSAPITPSPTTVSFNTNKPNKSDEGVSCFSSGVLESEVLKMANTD